MKKAKTYCYVVISCALIVVFYNALVWNFCNKKILSRQEGLFTGDLARIGYLSTYAQPRKNTVDLPRQHLRLNQYTGQPIDVVTIGDSFSQGLGNGNNRYYQDYLASRYNLSVLNIGATFSTNLIERVLILLNSGYLERLQPSILVLEIVERNCYKYSRPIDFSRMLSLDEVEATIARLDGQNLQGDDTIDLPEVGWLNTGNFKWLQYNLLYNFSPNAFFSSTYKLPLSTSLFSGDKGDTLLVHRKDLRSITKNGPEATKKLNANLNRLGDLLAERGIVLYFMPAPDKYNIYRPFILKNDFQESSFFETIRTLKKSYQFIDTQKVLSEQVRRGEKDVYWVDDTHWSWKASKVIAESVDFSKGF